MAVIKISNCVLVAPTTYRDFEVNLDLWYSIHVYMNMEALIPLENPSIQRFKREAPGSISSK